MHLKSKKRRTTGAFELKVQMESILFFPFSQRDLCSLKLYPGFNPVRDELPTLSETRFRISMPIKNSHNSALIKTKKKKKRFKGKLVCIFFENETTTKNERSIIQMHFIYPCS